MALDAFIARELKIRVLHLVLFSLVGGNLLSQESDQEEAGRKEGGSNNPMIGYQILIRDLKAKSTHEDADYKKK